MAKERLSKLQRWILKHAYMKMKQMKMPDDWIWCRHDTNDSTYGFNIRPSLGTDERMIFFKYDILANYFHLQRSSQTSYYGQYFSTGCTNNQGGPPFLVDWNQYDANNHAHVTVHNCLKNMKAKGLITVEKDWCYSNADEIRLTEKGETLILNVDGTLKDKDRIKPG